MSHKGDDFHSTRGVSVFEVQYITVPSSTGYESQYLRFLSGDECVECGSTLAFGVLGTWAVTGQQGFNSKRFVFEFRLDCGGRQENDALLVPGPSVPRHSVCSERPRCFLLPELRAEGWAQVTRGPRYSA